MRWIFCSELTERAHATVGQKPVVRDFPRVGPMGWKRSGVTRRCDDETTNGHDGVDLRDWPARPCVHFLEDFLG
jgi:hypothetical protein